MHIPCDGSLDCNDNWDSIICKVKNVANNWANRNATLYGKILIVNTLIGSLFVYRLSTILLLTDKQIGEVEKLLRDFIWNGKKPKISMVLLKKKKDQGGLRLVDMEAKQNTLRVAWIFKLINSSNTFLQQSLYINIEPEQNLNIIIWKCNMKPRDMKKHFGINTIWSQIIFAWSKINWHEPQDVLDVNRQVIWWNSHICNRNSWLYWPKWMKKGIIFINDLLDDQRNRKSYLDLGVNWLDLKMIWNSMPPMWLHWIENCPNYGQESESLFDKLFKTEIGRNRRIYNLFIDDDTYLNKYGHRWIERGMNIDFTQYPVCFHNLYYYTNISKFRDFQYRLLLGKITLNQDLLDWGISDSDKCLFCNTSVESMIHIFFECIEIQPIIDFFYNLWSTCELDFPRKKKNFILNFVNSACNRRHILFFVNMFIKQFIYKNRCSKSKCSLAKLMVELELHYQVEAAIAKRENKWGKHCKKWSPIIEFQVSNSQN